MKSLIITILILIISNSISAQNIDIEIDSVLMVDDSEQDNNKIIVFPFEKPARFPGGQDSLKCIIESQFNKQVIDAYESEGRVFVQWTIDSTGQMSDLEINPITITNIAKHLIFVENTKILNEIKSAYSNLPNWEPATMDSVKVKTKWIQMIKFPYVYKCNKSE